MSTTGQQLQWWSYIHGYYLNIWISLWGKDCYLHFRDKEKAADQLSKLPNFPQLAQIWKPDIFILLQFSFYYILRNHGIHWTIKRRKHPFHPPNKDTFWGMKNYENKQKLAVLGKAKGRSPWSCPFFPPSIRTSLRLHHNSKSHHHKALLLSGSAHE